MIRRERGHSSSAGRQKYSRGGRGSDGRGQPWTPGRGRSGQRIPREDRIPQEEPHRGVDDLKLITKRWEFNRDGKNKVLTDNTDFLVVGVMGGTATGKSSFLNSLCGLTASPKPESRKFDLGSPEDHCSGKHCTVGVDLRVSSNRVLLLDTQPVHSASVLLELLSCPSPCMELARALSVAAARGARPPQTSAEAINAIMALQTAIFLFSVCHVVIVLCDGPDDRKMWELVECADIFTPLVLADLPSSEGGQRIAEDTQQARHSPGNCVIVHTNMSRQDMVPHRVSALENAVQQLMGRTVFCRKGGVSCWSGTPLQETLNEVQRVLDDNDERIGFFVLPKTVSHKADTVPPTDCDSLHKALFNRLRAQLLEHNTRRFANGISERDWLYWCENVWEAIMKSKDVAEHFFRLQLTSFRDGGGW